MKRDYSNNPNVEAHYKEMRENQTYSFNLKMRRKFDKGTKKMSIKDAFYFLNNFVDVSDPDIDLPNIHHAFQTAEALKEAGEPDWMQLTGFIHDLGKIMYILGSNNTGTGNQKQWAITGDTWVVGCQIPDTIVYPEFNKLNKDSFHRIYGNEIGAYTKNCGLDRLLFSYGHDEFLYNVLKRSENCKLPQDALNIIRYHSCYLFHQGGEYTQFMQEKDYQTRKLLRRFNKYDLYSKENTEMDTTSLWEYYDKLINKYLPGSFMF
jgi:inositol oxygenase